MVNDESKPIIRIVPGREGNWYVLCKTVIKQAIAEGDNEFLQSKRAALFTSMVDIYEDFLRQKNKLVGMTTCVN